MTSSWKPVYLTESQCVSKAEDQPVTLVESTIADDEMLVSVDAKPFTKTKIIPLVTSTP